MSPVEVGSTNVYADLGFADPDAMQRKSMIAARISALATTGLNLPCDSQAEIMDIARGKFRHVHESRLLQIERGLHALCNG